MSKIKPEENRIIGEWVMTGDKLAGDDNCRRIDDLIANHLLFIGHSKKHGAWESLYKDPADNRYWIKKHPQGGLQGGGPPALFCVDQEYIKDNFDISE